MTIINTTGGGSAPSPNYEKVSQTLTSLPATFTPSEGYDAMSRVTVSADANFVPENIRSGVTTMGVTGTYASEDDLKFRELLTRTVTEVYDPVVERVGSYGLAFVYNCSVDLPNVTYLDQYAFYNASLTYLNVPKVARLGGYTFSCANVDRVDLPEVTALNLIYSGDFNYFRGTAVNLPKLIHGEPYSFSGSSKLTSVNVPLMTDVPNGMFSDCTSLTSLSLPSVTSIKTPFNNSVNLRELRLGADTVASLTGGLGQNVTITDIYVPDDLVDDYKSSTDWQDYTDFIRPISEAPE